MIPGLARIVGHKTGGKAVTLPASKRRPNSYLKGSSKAKAKPFTRKEPAMMLVPEYPGVVAFLNRDRKGKNRG